MAGRLNTNADGSASEFVQNRVRSLHERLCREVERRAYQAGKHLRNASQYVLQGQRSGRMYRVPGTGQFRVPNTGVMWQASAPGEPPAVRTGAFRASWQKRPVRTEKRGKKFRAVSAIQSGLTVTGRRVWNLGRILEEGTTNNAPRNMKPRPYKQPVRKRALPKIKDLYQKEYKV